MGDCYYTRQRLPPKETTTPAQEEKMFTSEREEGAVTKDTRKVGKRVVHRIRMRVQMKTTLVCRYLYTGAPLSSKEIPIVWDETSQKNNIIDLVQPKYDLCLDTMVDC